LSIRRNTTHNVLGAIVPLAISLITVPVYLGLIGEARYGVLAIAWVLLGYLGLLDLGLGRATAQRIAALRNHPSAERAQTFWTALALNVGLGITGSVLIWPIAAYFFEHIFIASDVPRAEMEAVVPWLMLAVPMATASGVLTGALQGRERFLELNLISVFGTVLFQLLPLAVAMLFGADLGILLPAALFVRLLTLLILFQRCWLHIAQAHSLAFSRSRANQLLRFGGWVAVTSFVGPLMTVLDRFIIGALSGAAAVAYYTIPFQLGERSTIISSALSSALFPRFASARPEEEQRLADEGLRALVVIMTPMVAAGILFMEPFLRWWITPELAVRSALVGQIILLGFWVNGFAKIPYAQLQARGRPDLVAKCHLGEALPYFCLLWLGLNTLGLAGAAAAFSFRTLVDFGMLARLAGSLQSSLRMLVTPSILLATAFLIALQIAPNRPEWFVLVALQLLVTVCWGWLRAPKHLKDYIFVRAFR
jgi:O-antigen/teichoic acid export membrane protein